MTYRLTWSVEDTVTPLHGINLDDTEEVYPVTEGEDDGPIIIVQRKKPDPIEIVLSAATGKKNPVLDLFQQAMFNLIVTESIAVNKDNNVVEEDVAITRYTRLKPYRIRRSVSTGRSYLHCMTFDPPVHEKSDD
ncbi:MAG: hypothetical protein CME32_07295 [Gimesia sp.]|nr:hypothetical protein [Gimesia sp.]